MAGLALPVVDALAVEVVHQVNTAATILAGVVFALVHIWGMIYGDTFSKSVFITKKCRAEQADV